MNEYVIKNDRLKNYLYALGFNYREVPNKHKENEFIYLFHNNDDLQESIAFYDRVHKKFKQLVY